MLRICMLIAVLMFISVSIGRLFVQESSSSLKDKQQKDLHDQIARLVEKKKTEYKFPNSKHEQIQDDSKSSYTGTNTSSSNYFFHHIGNCDIAGYRHIHSKEECEVAALNVKLPGKFRRVLKRSGYNVTVRSYGSSLHPQGCYLKSGVPTDDILWRPDRKDGIYFNPDGNPRSADLNRLSICAALDNDEINDEVTCSEITKSDFASALLRDSSDSTPEITKDGDRGISIYCYLVMHPYSYEIHLIRDSIDMGSLTGCDAFEIFSNTTDIPGFRAHPKDCEDSPNFEDAQGNPCSYWKSLDGCYSSHQTGQQKYSVQDIRDVRRNCPITCRTCDQGPGNFGSPVPSVIDGIKGPMDGVRGGKSNTVMNTPMFQQVYQKMFKLRTYQKHDLVVKLDSDTVFSANRLRALFKDENLSRPIIWSNSRWEMGILKEHAKVRPQVATHGPMVVMTPAALDLYAADPELCEDSEFLNSSIYDKWGEDWYLVTCLVNVLGAETEFKKDQLMEAIRYAQYHDQHCYHPNIVAYHPFKTSQLFYSCWIQMRIADVLANRDLDRSCTGKSPTEGTSLEPGFWLNILP